MKKQQINPPKMNIKFGKSETTLTALSTCRQHDRQRSLQEMGKRTAKKEHPIQEDLEKSKLNLAHFYPISGNIVNSRKMSHYGVRK